MWGCACSRANPPPPRPSGRSFRPPTGSGSRSTPSPRPSSRPARRSASPSPASSPASGIPPRNIIVWDRTNRELTDAGYKLNIEPGAVQVYGTDTAGAGYAGEPAQHRGIASLFSAVLTDRLTASVSLAVLKDHGMAGVTAGMKNYFGAIHNPNKYHDDHCDPYVAELFDSPPIKSRHRLTILDALLVQYHRGPSYHPRWAEPAGALVFSLDPVAADAVGWRMIEKLRAAKGLPSLEEDGRPPLYIATAEKLGLGRAREADIQVVEETVR